MTEKYLTNQYFTDFDLDPAVLRGIEEAKFEHCTPIQAETLPHLLAGHDVAGQAKTGTGKTAAFLVALFQHLIKHPAPESRSDSQPRALVLAPTRELAIQIDKDARLLGQHMDLRFRLVYGGTGYESQRRDLRAGVDVLIGTPGRIIDYLKQGIYSLDALQVMVLDEADRMFDLGFIKDIRYLFRRMPKATERLNMLFSATLSLRVNELAYEHMNNPRMVKIESERLTVDQVTQRVYFPSNEDKLPLLMGFLREAGDKRTLVFVNTKYQSERIDRRLQASGLKAGVLSGDVPQKKRERLLEQFTSGEINVLVATDVAARGLHIPDVSLVLNYDLPQDAEDYVHRIGRTARAGAAGDAISFACETYAFSLPDIEDFIGQKIEPCSYDKDKLVQPAGVDVERPASRSRGDRKGAGRRDRKNPKQGRETSGARRQASRSSGGKPQREEPAERPGQSAKQSEDAPVPPSAPGNGAPGHEEPAELSGQSTRQSEDAPVPPSAPGNGAPGHEERAELSGQSARQSEAVTVPPSAPGNGSLGREKPREKPVHSPRRRSHEVPAVG